MLKQINMGREDIDVFQGFERSFLFSSISKALTPLVFQCWAAQESTLEPGQFHKPTGRFDAAKRFKGASRWVRMLESAGSPEKNIEEL